MSDPINITCPKCSSSAGDQCRDGYARPKPFCKERTAAASRSRAPVAVAAPVAAPAATPTLEPVPARTHRPPAESVGPSPAPKPDDFDESTPPPRQRPHGVPLAADVVLPPGEDLVGIFGQWNREGRIPAGAILCESCGLSAFLDGGPQHRILAGVADDAAGPDLDGYRIVAVLSRQPSAARKWCVMAPMGGAR